MKKLDVATGAIVGSYAVGGAPVGIGFDGANIWVANLNDDTLQKLQQTGCRPLTANGGVLLSSVSPGVTCVVPPG